MRGRWLTVLTCMLAIGSGARAAEPCPDGTQASVRVAFEPGAVTGDLRAYLMVDAYPAALSTVLTVP